MAMKRKTVLRLAAACMAMMVCVSGFAVPALAYGGEDREETTESQETESDSAGDAAKETTGEDILDELSSLLGGMEEITVTEDGIEITAAPEEGSTQTGTVTTNGGKLNVRTGAGMEHEAFTQLANGTQVEVIGTEGDWIKVLLPEREGYVHSDYLAVSESSGGSFSFSLDSEDLSSILELFTGGNGGTALTPDGNLSLIDDIGSTTGSGKQFITVETKTGNVFYLIIDRDDKGEETVHFLNQVDEADLLALMEDGNQAAEAPVVCTCTEKCVAGSVDTSCPVCRNNMPECTGKEAVTEAETEPDEAEEPEAEKKGGTGPLLAVLLFLIAGGGAAAYFLVLKPKQGKKVPADLDDYDLEDEELEDEEYLKDDEDETEDTK